MDFTGVNGFFFPPEGKADYECDNILCVLKGNGEKTFYKNQNNVDLDINNYKQLVKDENKITLSQYPKNSELNVVFVDEFVPKVWKHNEVDIKDLRNTNFIDDFIMKYGTQEEKNEMQKLNIPYKQQFIGVYDDKNKSYKLHDSTAPREVVLTMKNIEQYIVDGPLKSASFDKSKNVNIVYFDKKKNILENYFGKVSDDGKRDGVGVYWFGNNNKYLYQGDFKNDRVHGKGRFWKIEKNELFEGSFANGGRIKGYKYRVTDLKDNTVYQGKIDRNFKRNGYGIETRADGVKKVGMWNEKKMHGIGKRIDPKGDVYQGYFEGNTLNNGITLNTLNGFGEKIYSNGGLYTGGVYGNNNEGIGIESLGDVTYEGEYKKNFKNGVGAEHRKDGTYYMGEWKNGKKEGFGEETTDNGQTYYQGQFKEGKQYGTGVKKKGNEITITKDCESIRITDGIKVQRTIDSRMDDSDSSDDGITTSKITIFDLDNDEKIEWNPKTENYVEFIERVEKIIKDKEEKRDKKNNNIMYNTEKANEKNDKNEGRGG